MRDRRRVAEAAIGDDARNAALHQPRHQNATGGGGPRILAAVDHHHRAGRAFLDGLALRMGAVEEDADRVEVFARRDVAQRVGGADHVAERGIERPHILDELAAQAALEKGVQSVAVLTVLSCHGLRC